MFTLPSVPSLWWGARHPSLLPKQPVSLLSGEKLRKQLYLPTRSSLAALKLEGCSGEPAPGPGVQEETLLHLHLSAWGPDSESVQEQSSRFISDCRHRGRRVPGESGVQEASFQHFCGEVTGP